MNVGVEVQCIECCIYETMPRISLEPISSWHNYLTENSLTTTLALAVLETQLLQVKLLQRALHRKRACTLPRFLV